MYEAFFFIATVGGLAGCAVFMVRYHLKSRGAWRRSEPGLFFMAVYLVLATLFLMLIAGRFLDDEWRRWIALTLYVVYATFAWWPNRLLNLSRKRMSKGAE